MAIDEVRREVQRVLSKHQARAQDSKQCECGSYLYDQSDWAKHQTKEIMKRLEREDLVTDV